MCLQGDAVFWYNLKRSGKGDYETEHAACPVLCGNKWGESLIGLVPAFPHSLIGQWQTKRN